MIMAKGKKVEKITPSIQNPYKSSKSVLVLHLLGLFLYVLKYRLQNVLGF